MRRFLLKALLAALAGSLFLAPFAAAEFRYAPKQEITGEGAEPEAVIEQGSNLYRSGKQEEALSLFRDFVDRHPDSPLLHKAMLYMARIYLDRGRYDNSLLYLDRIPADKWGHEARFLHGVALVKTGQPESGLDELIPLQDAPLFEDDRIRLFRGMAEANTSLGQPMQAAALYHRALSLGGETRTILEEVHQILDNRFTDTELAEAAYMFTGTAIGLDVILQQAQRAAENNEPDRAEELVRQTVTDPIPFPYRSEAIRLLERLTGTSWIERNRIGVILPLSGRYSPFGKLVRNGIELASRTDRDLKESVEFVYRDSEAEAEKGGRAVTQLGLEDRVISIIGPLSGTAATAAAQRAEIEGIPTLALSHKEGLPQIGDHIFRNSMTTRMQARALARHAVLDLDITSFGILAPKNPSGNEMTEAFTAEVKKLGGLVTDIEHYEESDTDFQRPILQLRGIDPSDFEQEQEEPSEEKVLADLFLEDKPEFAPATFDALFIPDSAERVGLIAPQLTFYGLEDVQLLGINSWNSPDLLRMAGQYVEGAILVDGFYAYSSYSFVREFVDLYYETYGKEPTILEAQAFDAAGIMLSLLKDESIRDRSDMRLALSQIKNYPGVTGATSFDIEGEADKILFLLQIRNGNIVQIDKVSDREH
ncbi:MAG: penicillin-binding protein activator [Desulfuromonadales bacterium]